MPLARDALGIGLRQTHYVDLLSACPKNRIDYLEIVSENFMNRISSCQQYLGLFTERYPVVMHGVGLNLLGSSPLDQTYLDRLRNLADRVDSPFVSDHLCWSAFGDLRHHDLLPVPFRRDLIPFAVHRIQQVQKKLKRPFALENVSSYVTFPDSEMTEWDFYTEVIEQADCFAMLDINNVFVSSQNHGFDPYRYLDQIDFSRVVQVHLAGHELQPDGLRIDTHDQPVSTPVWDLYNYAWKKGGPFPTLLEWDQKIPSLETVLAEINKAVQIRTLPERMLHG